MNWKSCLVPFAIGLIGVAAPATVSAQAKPEGGKPEAKATTGKVGEMVPEWKGKVGRGDKTADFTTTKNEKPTVYVLVGVTCPATGPYAERLAALEAAYTEKGVDFVYVYCNQTETLDQKKKFHKEKKFTAALMNDEGAAFTQKLGANKTGLTLIADKSGKVVYRGGIDDNKDSAAKVKSKHVANALDEILAGKAVSNPTNNDVFG